MKAGIEECLRQSPMFSELSPPQLGRLVAISQLQTWQRQQIIFRKGDAAAGFFVVKTGRVKVFNLSAAGKEQILNIFEPGDSFAEVVAFDNQPYPASAEAIEYVELIFLPRFAFLNLLHQDADLSVRLLASFARHLRHLVSLIEDLSFRQVPQRLAAYLLQRLATSDRPDSITLDLKKTELAALLGTIPATLSRAFYDLNTQGILKVEGNEITICDRQRLQRLSEE
ncbi:Crp/Fnr family transcriptional regulator [Thermosynechococcus sp. JY1334]|uniref:Crp/Fnr family transcriptional regulator n=1 Tax=unclassified Thermosynechococcus TaxID=2622553 RepID=UPI00197E4D69|nr:MULTISPECIES: Crp/Fnr family transcriptional regulator [unclassified Thermosynechococcus]QSF49731.1 Crp/Fnr family transcriptional regulator [Thermosynechococcus sp. TA-1]MDR5638450.1 Crp/Fnr family transcriptional regulator [Thermosynechococcus sp. PP42]MDR7897263.1 Crp/Fnr family transcriptional regulator [Thermosynechococcus sp. JY1332]MDR7904660.1 Crp/Fnr family transcriptional regulator [Thermosynechococcus sp. JY1334]MDR7921141.1 Crp/Fnr family transcriptional regulator [Thermosynecho